MNQRRALWRKVIYVCVIAVLLLPLSWLSQPATQEREGKRNPGGKLARMREERQLSQATLGAIDPASETIKLATLGMRGVAANILWEKANHYKMVEDWTSLKATLEQIKYLQPNFISVWRFQSWNLSYNVSSEFDDYRDRYYWVKSGMDYLKEGMTYNSKDPSLVADLGWFIGHKIGRSDEKREFRKMFKEDDDFHNADDPNRLRNQRDNWLVAKEKYRFAQGMVDATGARVKGSSPHIFHSELAKCQMNYAEAIEEEGVFGDVAREAWRKGGDDWHNYGNRDLPTSYYVMIRLNDLERVRERLDNQRNRLLKLVGPSLREQVRQEKINKLPEDQRKLFAISPEQRSAAEQARLRALEEQVVPSASELAERVPDKDRVDALKLAKDIARDELYETAIFKTREPVNFEYWRLRCKFEQDPTTVAARELIYAAERDRAKARLEQSAEGFEQGFVKWRAVIDKYPDMLTTNTVMEDLADSVDNYQKVLGQFDRDLPDEFILADVIALEFPTRAATPMKKKKPAEGAEPSETDKSSSAPGEKTEAGEKSTGEKSAREKSPGGNGPAEAKPKEPPAKKEPPKQLQPGATKRDGQDPAQQLSHGQHADGRRADLLDDDPAPAAPR